MTWADHEVNKFFRLGEFLPEDAGQILGNPIAWFWEQGRGNWLDRVSLALRTQFGPMTINDWAWGGDFHARGYRLDRGRSAIGSKGSRHRLGLALDCHFRDCTVQDVHRHIEKNQPYWMGVGVARYEKTQGGKAITWVHVDAGRGVHGFNA